MSIEHLVDRVQAALEAGGWLNCDPEDWAALRKRLVQPVNAVAWLRLPNLNPNERITLVADGEEYEIGRPDELAALRKDAERYRWLRDVAMDVDDAVPMAIQTDYLGGIENPPGYLFGSELDQAIDRARGVK